MLYNGSHKYKILNLIVLYIFVFSVFVDMYNGYIQMIRGTETIFPSLYKGIGIIIMLLYLLNKNKSSRIIYLLITIITLFIISLTYWTVKGYLISLGNELNFIIRIFYPYIVLLFLFSNRKYLNQHQLINYVLIYAAMVAVIMVLTPFTGIGVRSYGRNGNFGFGYQGLFIAGNDMGLTLLMCNCFSCYMFLHTCHVKYAVLNILITVGSILFASVAGTFGSVCIIACLLLSKLLIKNYRKITMRWQRIYITMLILIGIPILYQAVNFIITYDSFMSNKYSIENLLVKGARNELKQAGIEILSTYSSLDLLFGKGRSYVSYYIPIIMKRNKTGFEVDQYDFLSNYGIILGGFFLLLPILLAICFIKKYFRFRTPFYFWGALAMSLFVFHGFNAGHAFGSILPMQMAALFYFCYYQENCNKKIGMIRKWPL